MKRIFQAAVVSILCLLIFQGKQCIGSPLGDNLQAEVDQEIVPMHSDDDAPADLDEGWVMSEHTDVGELELLDEDEFIVNPRMRRGAAEDPDSVEEYDNSTGSTEDGADDAGDDGEDDGAADETDTDYTVGETGDSSDDGSADNGEADTGDGEDTNDYNVSVVENDEDYQPTSTEVDYPKDYGVSTVSPYASKKCLERRDPGICRGTFNRWHYDQYLKSCIKFVYSGCGGSDNNFDSREECRHTCATYLNLTPQISTKADTKLRCWQNPNVAQCSPPQPNGGVYWYNYTSGECEQLKGYCAKNPSYLETGNTFNDKADCEKHCKMMIPRSAVDGIVVDSTDTSTVTNPNATAPAPTDTTTYSSTTAPPSTSPAARRRRRRRRDPMIGQENNEDQMYEDDYEDYDDDDE